MLSSRRPFLDNSVYTLAALALFSNVLVMTKAYKYSLQITLQELNIPRLLLQNLYWTLPFKCLKQRKPHIIICVRENDSNLPSCASLPGWMEVRECFIVPKFENVSLHLRPRAGNIVPRAKRSYMRRARIVVFATSHMQ